MKKSILAILVFSTVIANAQFNKGDKYIGGNVSLGFFSSSSSQNDPVYGASENNFGITINVQKLKATNVNILQGFTLGWGFSNSNSKQDDPTATYLKTVSNGVNASIGYTVRKYKPIAEKLFWYMEYDASVGYSYFLQNNSYQTGNTKSHSSSYYISAAALPALAIKASDRLLVDVNFGGLNTSYNHYNYQYGHNSNFSLQLGFSSRITLGMVWKTNK